MKKYAKRCLALILTFAMVLAVPFVFSTQEASAAAKTKTKYVLTKSTTVTEYDGESKPDTDVYKVTYNKNGLFTSRTYGNGEKSKVTRNSKGYVSKALNYDAKGKLLTTETYTYKYNKKGLPKTEKCYVKEGSKKKALQSTTTYTYYSNKQVKKAVMKGKDHTSTTEFRKDGSVKKYTDTGKEYKSTGTCDKHGNSIKSSYKNSKSKDVWTDTSTYKYNKNGDPVKKVTNGVSTYDGKTYKSKTVTTYKYTYDSHKNITKVVETDTYTSDDFTSTTTRTTTNTYKKVKIPKKYWNLYI